VHQPPAGALQLWFAEAVSSVTTYPHPSAESLRLDPRTVAVGPRDFSETYFAPSRARVCRWLACLVSVL
jgi:hypothetical protein